MFLTRVVRCLVGGSVTAWLLATFTEPSCTDTLALLLIAVGSLLSGGSFALYLKERPGWAANLERAEALAFGVCVWAIASVVSSTLRVGFSLPPMDAVVLLASLSVGCGATTIILAPPVELADKGTKVSDEISGGAV